MGLGGLLAEMQVAGAPAVSGVMILVVMVRMSVTMVMMTFCVVVMFALMMRVGMMRVGMMVVGMRMLVIAALSVALAVNANVLRPAAAHLAHGYLPLLVVDVLPVDGSPA
jgi:hypothetical protein